MPVISIIVPVFNMEAYLKRCIDSLINQTITDVEIILIDDGSTDSSGSICDKYAEKDSRIKVIHKTNAGVAAARNSGLDLAEGKYVMFCDSDDFADHNWCKYLYESVNNDINIGICRYKGVSFSASEENTIRVDESSFDKSLITVCNQSQFWDVFEEFSMESLFNKIFDLNIINKNNIRFCEDKSYGEDACFVFDYLLCINGNFGAVDKRLYYYVQARPGSLTNKYIPSIWEIKLQVFDYIDKLLSKFGIDKNSIKDEYYTKWIQAITWSVSSELVLDNDEKFSDKIKNLRKILKSRQCKTAFRYGCFDGISKMYELVLKSRSEFLILFYTKLSRIKNS